MLRIIDQQEFDYAFLVSGSERITLRDRIWLGETFTIGVSVRVHALDAPLGAFDVELYRINPSPHDGADFSVLAVTVAIAGPAPNLIQASTPPTPVQAPMLRAVLLARDAGGQPLYARLSMDLVLKEAGS